MSINLLLKLIEGEICHIKCKKKISKSIKNYFNELPSGDPKSIEQKAKCARLLKKSILKTINDIERMKQNPTN